MSLHQAIGDIAAPAEQMRRFAFRRTATVRSFQRRLPGPDQKGPSPKLSAASVEYARDAINGVVVVMRRELFP